MKLLYHAEFPSIVKFALVLHASKLLFYSVSTTIIEFCWQARSLSFKLSRGSLFTFRWNFLKLF